MYILVVAPHGITKLEWTNEKKGPWDFRIFGQPIRCRNKGPVLNCMDGAHPVCM
jgi:hypothetical protein